MTKPSRSAFLASLALFAVACGISATGELSPTPGNTAGSAGSSGIAGSPAGGASGNGGGPGGSGQGGVSGTSGQGGGGASGSDPGGAAGTGGAGNAGVGGDGGAGGDSGSAGNAGAGGDSGSAGNAGVGGDGGAGGTSGAGGDGGSAGNAGIGGDGGVGGDSGSAGVAGNAGVGGDSGAGGDSGSAGNAGAGGCAEGFLDCDGQASNSCETNITQDKANCGACGQICGENNAEAICENSTCKLTCQGSFLDCDGQASSGCEADSKTDAANCGTCGTACQGGPNGDPLCSEGLCKLTCQGSFLDCDNQTSTGCEVDGSVDVANCGTCGTICEGGANGSASCEGGACKLTCQGSFLDCDNQTSTGCEADSNTDAKNCGTCGKVCASDACSGGKCLASIFPATAPDCKEATSASNLEFGNNFKTSVPGAVTAIRFFKKEEVAATYTVNLWDSSGKNLATAQIPIADAQTGWISVALSPPVDLVANETYMVSYKIPSGKYCAINGVKEIQNPPLTLLLDNSYYNNKKDNKIPNLKLANTVLADVLFEE